MTGFSSDPDKDAANRATHGVPLLIGTGVFEGPFIAREDRRRDYGETRFVAIGPIARLNYRLYIVIYTWRAGERRLISVRKANDREIDDYRDGYA